MKWKRLELRLLVKTGFAILFGFRSMPLFLDPPPNFILQLDFVNPLPNLFKTNLKECSLIIGLHLLNLNQRLKQMMMRLQLMFQVQVFWFLLTYIFLFVLLFLLLLDLFYLCFWHLVLFSEIVVMRQQKCLIRRGVL